MSLRNLRSKQISALLMTMTVAFGLSLAVATPVHAEGEPATETQDQQVATQDYGYTAKKSNNLTLLVRRSLQLHDEANEQVSLSEAQIVYAETNIVRELGAFAIDVGQEVTVPADLVAKYAASSQDLSASQLKAWERYAKVATFDLSQIEPSTASDKPASADNEDEAGDEVAQDQATEKAKTEEAAKNNGGTDWWWFAVLAAAILVMWYWLRERESTPAARTTRTRKK